MAEKSSLESLWGQRIAGIDLQESDILRPITHAEVEYLLNKYPFLYIINSKAKFEGEIIPKFFTSNSGWTIHDYGDAMSSSPGKLLFDGWDDQAFLKTVMQEENDDEGGAGEADATIESSGKGTIIKQMVDTAVDMVNLAISKKWAGIEIIDGTKLMEWAAWATSQVKDLEVSGFTPEEEDEKRYERVTRSSLKKAEQAPQPSI